MPQDYPMMIYHIETGSNKVINSEEDLKFWESHGWTKNYQVFDDITTTKKKIEWHKKELEQLEKKLQNYDYEVKIVTEVPTNQVSEMAINNEANFEKNTSETAEEIKKRGRPRKEG